jgi:hypothetical protein
MLSVRLDNRCLAKVDPEGDLIYNLPTLRTPRSRNRFSAPFDKNTKGRQSPSEAVLFQAFVGVADIIPSGQSLCIMDAADPELAYTIVFYNVCERLSSEFMPAPLWESVWGAFPTIFCTCTNGCAIYCYVTQYTEDMFLTFINLTFMFEAVMNVADEFSGRPDAVGFLLAFLAMEPLPWGEEQPTRITISDRGQERH